jgi:hypothetical protein
MRGFLLCTLLVAIAFACGFAKDETVDDLKSRFENARPEDRAELAIHIARLQLDNADKLYTNGNVDQANAAVTEVVTYSEKAGDAAKQTDKHLKNIEIVVRKIADKLRDIKRTLAFDDQPPLEQAIRRLEDLRTSLLQEMFAKDKSKEKK